MKPCFAVATAKEACVVSFQGDRPPFLGAFAAKQETVSALCLLFLIELDKEEP